MPPTGCSDECMHSVKSISLFVRIFQRRHSNIDVAVPLDVVLLGALHVSEQMWMECWGLQLVSGALCAQPFPIKTVGRSQRWTALAWILELLAMSWLFSLNV